MTQGAPTTGQEAPLETSKALGLLESGVLQRFVCGGFAWVVTVLPFAFGRDRTGWGMAAAVSALVCAIVGPLGSLPFGRRIRGSLQGLIGIGGFAGFSTLAWLSVPKAIDPNQVDPFLATVSALAWIVFALSWGEPWALSAKGQEDGAPNYRGRAELPPLAVPIASIGVVGALLFQVLAFGVRDSIRAIFAQVAAIGLGVALVSVSARVAIERGKSRPRAAKMTDSARSAIMLLVAVAILGGVLWMLRRG